MMTVITIKTIILSFVDDLKAVADGGEVGAQRRKLVPAIAHQLNQLNIVGGVVCRDRRSERRRLTATHTHEYICLQLISNIRNYCAHSSILPFAYA